MNKIFLDATTIETTSETINEYVNISIVNIISNFIDNDIAITIITTLIGIVAGFAFSIKNRFWRNFIFILCAVLFNIFMLLRMIFISEPWYYFVFSIVIWIIVCVLAMIFLREKNIVSRKKIGKMIIDFTSIANPGKDVCIFAGDIDFFGDVIELSDSINASKTKDKFLCCPKKRTTKRMLEKKSIENNRQFKQLIDLKFRSICILCIKPPVKKDNIKDDYHKDRIRIGYIKKTLGERVHFKFFNNECSNCFFNEQNNCVLQRCEQKCFENLTDPCECPKCKSTFLQPSLPDTTLRGRIVTNRETDAKCVAITTKRSSRKDYILRQYGSGEKESSLYNVIWKVWWSLCEEDDCFITDCINEYEETLQKSNGEET